LTNEQNRFVLVNGIGYMFAYRNLVTSCVEVAKGSVSNSTGLSEIIRPHVSCVLACE